MVGIESGRFSSEPAFGIQTRLVGLPIGSFPRFSTSVNLWFGVRDLIPSTPAVFLP
jgi:hypothetical protein